MEKQHNFRFLIFSGALKIDEDWEGDMGEEEEEEEEEGDSEGKDIDYSNMLAVDITEQVRWQQSFETLSNT